LNLAARGTTTLDPHGLLRRIKKVESEMGRTATVRYGPRPIDIDILFFDDLVISSEALTVPHPLLAERGFVLVPLAEIAPEVRHPVVGATVSQLLARLSRTDDVVTLGRTLATAGRS
jgi:2-amino-4-hydroxy-6-hydroxymethyldihydropteridine diphosphokinase